MFNNEQKLTLLDGLMSKSPYYIGVKDSLGRYLWVNEKFSALFELRSEQLVGKTSAEILPAEVNDEILEKDLNVLMSAETKTYISQAPIDGKLYTFETTRFPLLDANGMPFATCFISNRIEPEAKSLSEIQRLKRKIAALEAQIEIQQMV